MFVVEQKTIAVKLKIFPQPAIQIQAKPESSKTNTF